MTHPITAIKRPVRLDVQPSSIPSHVILDTDGKIVPWDTIVAELNGGGLSCCLEWRGLVDCHVAEIDRQSAQLSAMQKALEPLAKIADDYERKYEIEARHHSDERGRVLPPHPDSFYVNQQVTLGQCRSARAASASPPTTKERGEGEGPWTLHWVGTAGDFQITAGDLLFSGKVSGPNDAKTIGRLIVAAVNAYTLATPPAAPPDAAEMRAFGASDAACYLWPEDTKEHRACRAAYIRGAADCVPRPDAQVAALREALKEARREIISLAESGTEKIRELGGGDNACDPAERTYGPAVARIDAALSTEQPAGAGWQPIEPRSIEEAQQEIARLQSWLSFKVLGDPRKSVGLAVPAPPSSGTEGKGGKL